MNSDLRQRIRHAMPSRGDAVDLAARRGAACRVQQILFDGVGIAGNECVATRTKAVCLTSGGENKNGYG